MRWHTLRTWRLFSFRHLGVIARCVSECRARRSQPAYEHTRTQRTQTKQRKPERNDVYGKELIINMWLIFWQTWVVLLPCWFHFIQPESEMGEARLPFTVPHRNLPYLSTKHKENIGTDRAYALPNPMMAKVDLPHPNEDSYARTHKHTYIQILMCARACCANVRFCML